MAECRCDARRDGNVGSDAPHGSMRSAACQSTDTSYAIANGSDGTVASCALRETTARVSNKVSEQDRDTRLKIIIGRLTNIRFVFVYAQLVVNHSSRASL